MKITLAQAVPLAAAIVKRIQNLVRERSDIAFVEAAKGEEYKLPSRTFTEVSKELADARLDLRKLDGVKARANVDNTIDIGDEEIPIIEALELGKQLRQEALEFTGFGIRKKEEFKNSWNTAEINIVVYALYDPDKARQRGIKILSIADTLSSLIQSRNEQILIDFPSASKYISSEFKLELDVE